MQVITAAAVVRVPVDKQVVQQRDEYPTWVAQDLKTVRSTVVQEPAVAVQPVIAMLAVEVVLVWQMMLLKTPGGGQQAAEPVAVVVAVQAAISRLLPPQQAVPPLQEAVVVA
jgi:hypothetical protein